MKATVLTFFLILSVIVNVCAQKANVTISEPTYVKGRTGTKLILGEKDGKIFVVSQYGNNEKNPTLHVETYDAKSLKQSASNKVELSNTESTKSDLEAVTLEDQLYIWYSQRYRSKETKDLVHQAVLTPIADGMPKTQIELDYFPNISDGMNSRITTSVFFKLSQDSTKLIIYNMQDGKEVAKEYKEQVVVTVSVYDIRLKQVLKKQIPIKAEEKYTSVEEINVDKDNNITILSKFSRYSIVRKFPTPTKRLENPDYYILSFIKKNEKTAVEYIIDSKGKDKVIHYESLKHFYDSEGNIVLVGFAKEMSESGSVYCTYLRTIKKDNFSILNEKIQPLSKTILKEVLNKDSEYKYGRFEIMQLYNLGESILFVGQCIKFEIYSSNEKGVSDLVTYTPKDILIYQFDLSGEIMRESIVPRGTVSSARYTIFDQPLYFQTYAITSNQDKLTFIFYDAPANLSKTSSNGIVEASGKPTDMLVLVTVDETGKWKKQNLTPALKGAKPLNIRDARRTSDGSLIFISGEKEQEKLVKISVTN